MSDTTTLKTGTATLHINTIGLIAGISIVTTILITVVLVWIIIRCRKSGRRRDRDRSAQYMVHDGTSPFSSLHAPSSGAVPSYNGLPNQWGSSYFIAPGYENKAADLGEFRPNPLAESPFDRNIPQYGSKQQRYLAPQLSRSPPVDLDSSFHASLYERLQDTIHSNRGRPLYLCRRDNYQKIAGYFDVVGKTRTSDLLVRPRDDVPNRPVKRSKKHKAPKPGDGAHSRQQVHRTPSYRDDSGYLAGPRMNAPFGPANRMPTRFVGSSYHGGENDFGAGYTSLPRDGRLQGAHDNSNGKLRRQVSHSAADTPARDRNSQLDEKRYAEVLKKNSLQGEASSSDQTNRHNPRRRAISPIEEIPHSSRAEEKSVPDGRRERTSSVSTVKSLGITDQFKFLEQYDTEEERF